MKESFLMTRQEDTQDHFDGFRMTEKEHIRNCLDDFRKIIAPARHKQLFDMFYDKDTIGIAIMLGSVSREWKNISIENDNKIKSLQKSIEDLEMQLEEKDNIIAKLSEERDILDKLGRTHDIETLKSMRHMYENGKSFREIGKTFDMDKSTVKRKLIQMGVTIRKK